MQHYDMIVIGGGPGGYTAALYAARAGLSVVVLEKLSAGGQMALSTQIDNYPGFTDGIDGLASSVALTIGVMFSILGGREGGIAPTCNFLARRGVGVYQGGRVCRGNT